MSETSEAQVGECRCKAEMEAAMAERVPEGATEVRAEVEGYVWLVNGSERPALPGKVTYLLPKKSGGTKRVTTKPWAIASYCPFCGKSLLPAKSATPTDPRP